MGILSKLIRWNDRIETEIAGAEAAKDFYRQGNYQVSDDVIDEIAWSNDIPPDQQGAFAQGFGERWDEHVEAQELSGMQQYFQGKYTMDEEPWWKVW